MGCENDQVLVRRGNNSWLLIRTDEDAANEEAVVDSLGEFLAQVLGPASPLKSRGIFEQFELPGEGHRWVIGAARPVKVTGIAQPDNAEEALAVAQPEGELIGRYEECSTIRTVAGQRPWFIAITFDWRAPDKRIDWPRKKVTLGIPHLADHDLEWLLMAASYRGLAKSKDTDFLHEVSEETQKKIQHAAGKAKSLLKPILWGIGISAAVSGLAYYLINRPPSPPRKRLS